MPLHPKKILVATDFSACAQAAADAAGVLARAFAGEVTLLHAVPLSSYAEAVAHLDRSTFSTQDLRATVQADMQRQGQAELARLESDGVHASFLTVEGPPPAEIARVAIEGQYDLLIIGTHGPTGKHHLALGSVAENVVRLSSVPVLVMRSKVATPQ